MNELYHYGVKGMHWGIRKDAFKKTATKTMRKFLGIENKHLNKALRSSGKLRKAYVDMQSLGVKTDGNKNKYTDKEKHRELYLRQQSAARRAKRYANEFLEKYDKKPMSYLESLNAQRGAAIGTAAGIAIPVILPLWATIPAGYYIGSHIGGDKVKHSDDELMHHGVKGMKWHKHVKRTEDDRSGKSSRRSEPVNPINDLLTRLSDSADRIENRGGQFERTVTNLFNNGNYTQALSTALTAYQTDKDVRFAMDTVANTTLDNLSNSSDWKTALVGRMATNALSIFSNTLGRQRRGTRAEVAAYETQMANEGGRGRRPSHSGHSSSHHN